ncbi:MAG TPA: tyrosine--tRNA ligase, partial [Chloroflexota bacterium]|nr:tyrosine--tRNA ligase [Chloroflexota bacterium]
GVLGITPENGLEEKLAVAAREHRPLRVKLGLDPTAPDIHLGFAVVLRKLRQFQDLGHQVILIIGDYTALIGDPSGRSATRPMLSIEDIQENSRTYVDQLTRILDGSRTTVRFNSEWLGKLDFAELVSLTSKMTVAQVMERDDFAKRWAAAQPISLHELLYPLAQAYDSVMIDADVEMGGQDQTFNILAGRHLQRELGREPQIGLFMPILVGLDGVKKMSKSLGNYVGISEQPDTMFGKLMSISDEMMSTYFELCTDMPMADVSAMLADAREGRANPKDVKRTLAREIVSMYHNADAATEADAAFERVHARHELPDEMPETQVTGDLVRDGRVWICRLVVAAGFAKGTGDARRLVQQGGVSVGGAKFTDPAAELPLDSLDGAVLKVGSRNFARLRIV